MARRDVRTFLPDKIGAIVQPILIKLGLIFNLPRLGGDYSKLNNSLFSNFCQIIS
jgi:hypothetical protein